jgi:hypothetical protein
MGIFFARRLQVVLKIDPNIDLSLLEGSKLLPAVRDLQLFMKESSSSRTDESKNKFKT